MRRSTAAAVAALLALSACSSNDDETSSQTSATESVAESSAGGDSETPDASPTPTEDPVAVISDEGIPTPVEEDGLVTLDFEGATDPGQLQVAVIEEGDGEPVEASDMVVANYEGQVWGNDTPFDSSWERGDPTSFGLSQVIAGWRIGLTDIPVGSRVVISIPAELGYGPQGGNAQAGIGPDDTIVFTVDVLATMGADDYGDPDAEQVTDPADLPVTIEGDLGGPVTLTVKDDAEEPEEEKLTVLAESDGEPVDGEGSSVFIQYTITTWDNATTQSSIELGGLQTTSLGQGTVWEELAGVPVGSRVLLVVPATESAPAMAMIVDVVGQMPKQASEE